MPDLYRVTYAFSGKQQGWSESLIFPADNTTPGAFNGVVALPIAQKRAELLGREFTLDNYRVSKIRLNDGTPVKRNVLLFTPDLSPTMQSAANAAEKVNLCALVQGISADGSKRKYIFMRGIPDQISIDGGGYDPNGAGGWQGRFNSWAALVVGAQGGWVQSIPLHANIALTTYVVNPNGTVTFTWAAPLFDAGQFGTKQIIRTKGINGASILNGAINVVPADATHCTTVDAIAVFAYQFGGRGTSYTSPYPFISAVSWNVSKIATHKTGRPIYATRGRAKARARG